MEHTMKAIVRDAYGSVDVLRLAEIDTPVAGEGEVLVRVHAAGVDQGVWHLMVGMPYVMRLAGFGIRAPKNALLGYDVAWRVEAVGACAGPFRRGTRYSEPAGVPSPSMPSPALKGAQPGPGGVAEAGAIRPAVDRMFPLEEVPTAIRYLRDGHARGKIVIIV